MYWDSDTSEGEKLSEFFEFFRGLDFGLGQSFVKIEQPPPSFINAMEDYVTEAPHVIALQCTAIRVLRCYKMNGESGR
ncbi:hypothetical protein DKX38_010051 [Salix brachista]|uniref:Uncharacterized protein n=1 Tax=Salix brachista TaxID=2182728 RepID=A0A5N5MC32_9ROSI|nr:hypothetical protein DKX38_010051 [Salix brachista]